MHRYVYMTGIFANIYMCVLRMCMCMCMVCVCMHLDVHVDVRSHI